MPTRTSDPPLPPRPSAPTDGAVEPGANVGLSEALRLLTDFSLHARSASGADAAQERGALVPVPQGPFCRFAARRWSELDEAERDAFGRFYALVGEELEDVADSIEQGAEIDEAAWAAITAGVAARKRGT